MKRNYETCVVYDGSLSDEEVEKQRREIENFLNQNSSLEKVDAWGKRKLAYEIKNQKMGNYLFFIYEAEGDVPSKLDRMLKLNQNVLRLLTIRRRPGALNKEVEIKKGERDYDGKQADESENNQSQVSEQSPSKEGDEQ